MPRFMLDTGISSYIMKRSHPAVLRRLQATHPHDVCVSVITKAELLYGVAISQRQAQDQAALDAYLQHVEVLPYPDHAALHYAEIRAGLKKSGAMIGANDLFIAAHARSLSHILVSNNVREFSQVPGLSLENWTEPSAS